MQTMAFKLLVTYILGLWISQGNAGKFNIKYIYDIDIWYKCILYSINGYVYFKSNFFQNY